MNFILNVFLGLFHEFLYYQAPFHSGYLWAGRGMQLCFCKFAEGWQEYNDRSASSHRLEVITVVVFALKLGPEITSRSWNHRINCFQKPLVASIFAQSAPLAINRQDATCDIEDRKTTKLGSHVVLPSLCWLTVWAKATSTCSRVLPRKYSFLDPGARFFFLKGMENNRIMTSSVDVFYLIV
jgi:hypothetical protein